MKSMKSSLKSNPPMTNRTRGFYTSATIFESCDFRSQFDPLLVAYTGGSSPLALPPPPGFLGKGKNQVFRVIKKSLPSSSKGGFPFKKV